MLDQRFERFRERIGLPDARQRMRRAPQTVILDAEVGGDRVFDEPQERPRLLQILARGVDRLDRVLRQASRQLIQG